MLQSCFGILVLLQKQCAISVFGLVCALKVDTYLGRPLEKKKGRKGFEFFITKAKHFRFYKISRRKGKGLLLCRCCAAVVVVSKKKDAN